MGTEERKKDVDKRRDGAGETVIKMERSVKRAYVKNREVKGTAGQW